MAAAPDARAMCYTLYTDVTIYQDSSGTLVDSDGHVRCVDYSGNITTGSVSIQLWITEPGSTRGMITVNSTINDWRSTTWTGLNIPNCYTGQITATAGGVGRGCGARFTVLLRTSTATSSAPDMQQCDGRYVRIADRSRSRR
jgi:hypothetical protein